MTSLTSPPSTDVLVIGAGPTGLTAAAEAARLGLTVRIVERKETRSTYSKALVNHARTLEVFQTMGMVEPILEAGVRFRALNANVGAARHHHRIDLLAQPWGDTAYPFWLSIPQYETERILEEHLNSLGPKVEWRTELRTLTQNPHSVTATLLGPSGEEVVSCRWLVGADGGRSRTRELAGIELERVSEDTTFVLADILTTCDLVQDEGHTYLHPLGLLLIVPMPEPGRFRVIAHMPGVGEGEELTLDEAFFDELILSRAGVAFGSHDLTWTSQFRLTHGLADRYQQGRVFLAGDAAHIHSPVGGQGLNTGVQDAHNLMWKLALAQKAGGPVAGNTILESYHAERHTVAAEMVGGVARATGVLTTENPVLKVVRTPLVRMAVRQGWVQSQLSRNLGMLNLRYTESPILGRSEQAGARLPDLKLKSGERLHAKLDDTQHTWLVMGSDPGEALIPKLPRGLPEGLPVVHLQSADLDPSEAPIERTRVLLVRPDRYICAEGQDYAQVWSQVGDSLKALSS